jgi:uncharacterized protein (DUF1330 family)
MPQIEPLAPSTEKLKGEVVDEIIEAVKKQGGRFLKRNEEDSTLWIEVNAAAIRIKVAMAFRSRRKAAATSKRAAERENAERSLERFSATHPGVIHWCNYPLTPCTIIHQ